MACKFICDGCGKEQFAGYNGRDWVKPKLWFQRSDDDGPQDACSRECIDKISKLTGKTRIILPI